MVSKCRKLGPVCPWTYFIGRQLLNSLVNFNETIKRLSTNKICPIMKRKYPLHFRQIPKFRSPYDAIQWKISNICYLKIRLKLKFWQMLPIYIDYIMTYKHILPLQDYIIQFRMLPRGPFIVDDVIQRILHTIGISRKSGDHVMWPKFPVAN